MKAQKDSPLLTIAFIALLVMILLISVLATLLPFFLAAAYLYCSYRSDEVKKNLAGNMSDFWLSAEEKTNFREKADQYVQVATIVEDANNEGNKAGVSRNKDGSFSARSNLGKKIRAINEEYLPFRDKLGSQVLEMQHRPLTRWQTFANHVKNSRAFSGSLIVWIVAVAAHFLIYERTEVREILVPFYAPAYNFFKPSEEKIELLTGDIQMVLISTVFAIIAYFLLAMIFRNSAARYTPRPDPVTLENIDQY